MSKLLIFGTQGIAKLAYHYFKTDSEYDVVGFVVDKAYKKNDTFQGLPLHETESISKTYPPADYKLFIAMSYVSINQKRAAKYEQMKALGYELVSYISSRCTFLTEEPVGDNCFILEDNTIQPFVKIGNNNFFWCGNIIGHEAVIDDHCFLAGGVAIGGYAHLNDNCFLGPNVTVKHKITLAPYTLCIAGCVILNDTVEKGVYYPERAKLHSKKSDFIDL